jgi:hypothetical protein
MMSDVISRSVRQALAVGVSVRLTASARCAWTSCIHPVTCQLRADLDRFTFLLGGSDGEPLFQPEPG